MLVLLMDIWCVTLPASTREGDRAWWDIHLGATGLCTLPGQFTVCDLQQFHQGKICPRFAEYCPRDSPIPKKPADTDWVWFKTNVPDTHLEQGARTRHLQMGAWGCSTQHSPETVWCSAAQFHRTRPRPDTALHPTQPGLARPPCLDAASSRLPQGFRFGQPQHPAGKEAACGHPGLANEVVCCLPAQPPAVCACGLRTVRHCDNKWPHASGHCTETTGFYPPLWWFQTPWSSGGLHLCRWHQLLPRFQRPTRHTHSARGCLLGGLGHLHAVTCGSIQRRQRRWSSLSANHWIWHRSPLATM